MDELPAELRDTIRKFRGGWPRLRILGARELLDGLERDPEPTDKDAVDDKRKQGERRIESMLRRWAAESGGTYLSAVAGGDEFEVAMRLFGLLAPNLVRR